MCTEDFIILALCAGSLCKAERLEYPRDYLVHHLPVGLPLLSNLELWNIAVLDWNPKEGDKYGTFV